MMNADDMQRMIDRAAADLGRLGATPQLLQIADAAREEAREGRIDTVRELANINHLSRSGITPPAGLRLAPRTFEDADESAPVPLVSFESGRGAVYYNGSIITVEAKS
jgi:hypothetical protein